jgi:methylated-DNA-[protein]-cysteine S-methyltransferase
MSGLVCTRVATPLGAFVVLADHRGVRWADFEDSGRLERLFGVAGAGAPPDGDPLRARDALAAYFAGELDALARLPVHVAGTPFQHAVWDGLREIPFGETRSYTELAAAIGRPRAVRAVGAANGANPVSLVVPCHRVIGSGGDLTGYGGGLERKRWLLEHERYLAASAATAAGIPSRESA